MKKYIAHLFFFPIITFLLCGCGKEKIIENYSVGLTENGYYEDFYDKEYNIPTFLNLKISQDELLDFGKNSLTTYFETEFDMPEGTEITKDMYIETYASQLLSEMGLANKEIVEDGDLVDVILTFKDAEGDILPDYSNLEIATYMANKNGDSILKSFIGHKVGEQYSTEYVFTEDDAFRAGETATVEIFIDACRWADPLANGVLEANIKEIQKTFPNVVDKESYINELLPYIAQDSLYTYISDLISNSDFDVPKEFIEYERDRLLFRLQQIGVSYDAYLVANNTNDEEVLEYLKSIVRSNIITMKYFELYGVDITDGLLTEFYGEENIDYLSSVQGVPYLKLRMMREYVINYIVSTVVIE